MTPDREARFWAKVDKSGPTLRPELGPCWVWTAALHTSGYGWFAIGNGRSARAHRVSWELARGPIPPEKMVLHRCDNRRCVRPDHLFLGTSADNVADMVAKGRAHDQRGSRNGHAKLTERQVLELRRRVASGEPYARVGEEFGITRPAAFDIVTGRRWRGVGGPLVVRPRREKAA